MGRNLLLIVMLVLIQLTAKCQDFSNKGKDFWVGYGYHQVMKNGNLQQMVLYFATDAVTDITIEIPRLGYVQTYTNVAANTIFTSNPLPKIGAQDSRLQDEGISDKGIHITSSQPIVAYAHIYNSSVSGATLLFPTNTLGREYYSINFEQVSNVADANCWAYAIAVDTGITTVEVIPSANTLTHIAGVPFTVNLQRGQVFNIMGKLTSTSNPFTGVDLTGTSIKSIASGTGSCKRIAVFSGSGRLSVACQNNSTILSTDISSSSDNYIVQAFPKNAWGKKYLTIPTSTLPNNFYRICVSDASTIVKVNGAQISGLRNNFYYQISSNQPNVIEADKPITVAQVITSESACLNNRPGDPEIIYLSPVEQVIDKVILNSTSNFAITQHWINVVIKSSAINSFKIDGNSYSNFITHPRDANYSYAQISVSAGQHRLTSDSGFNAIAYGYGSAESYGYNAGTNVKDLYQFVSIQNQFATVNFPSSCVNTPFVLSMTLPYQPTELKWVFGTALNAQGVTDITLNNPASALDSTWVVNGKTLYRYKLATSYIITTPGTYPIKVLAQNPTADGCSGEQEINYELLILDRPKASFTVTSTGCLSDPVQFTDNSTNSGRPAVQWAWDFGDASTSQLRNPSHLFSAPNSYNIKFHYVSDIGCLSDTVEKQIVISTPPVAKFDVALPNCAGKNISFSDGSTISSGNIARWVWDFGDGTPVVIATTNASQSHSYAAAGTYTATLQVESASGCKSIIFQKIIVVAPNPVSSFNFGNACLPNAAIQFTDASTISDGTQAQFTYAWTFGDGGTSTQQSPTHTFTSAGPFQVGLQVTSNAGCIGSSVKTLATINAQPQAAFTAPAEVCFGTSVNFTDASTVTNSTIAQWQWNFGDGATSTQQSPTHNYAAAGTYTVTLTVTSAAGCVSVAFTKQVVINALPVADFATAAPPCVSKSIQFINSSSTASGTITKWSWNFGDGSATSNLPSPVHTYTTVGSYTVSLTVETDKGCISTVKTKQILVSAVPVPGFIMPGNCVNDPLTQFTNTSSISDGTASQFTYLWNFGDVAATGTNPNTSTIKNGSHSYTAVGNYNVMLTVTSANGCSASVTQTFTINGAVPATSFTVEGGLQHCSNDTINVTDHSIVTPGKLVKLEIYWDYTGDPTNKLVVDNPVPGTVYPHKYPEFFTPATKAYSIVVVAYSGINCLQSSAPQVVVMKATPDISFPAVLPVCADVPAFPLGATVSNLAGGTPTYSGSGVSTAGIFNPAIGAGTYPIRYTYTGANGCRNFKEQAITVYKVPTVNAGPDRFVLEGGTTVLTAIASGSGLSYLWTPATYLNNTAVLQPVSAPQNDIEYKLTVTSSDGCKAADSVLVKLLKAPTIPNVFTPNGDGINDTWVIEYLESYPGATVEIFNRYGSVIFKSIGYPKPWDGTFNGKQAPAGTYYYIINPKNGRQQISGFVDIVR